MKKFLEVLVDEDGKYHFSTDEAFVSEEEFTSEDVQRKKIHMERCDRMLERLVHDMTEFMWQNKEQRVSQAVRMVAMAEILGCAQPYEHAEEFWSLMMFHTIPQFERYAASIKRPYGFDDRAVNRPLVGGPFVGSSPDMLPFPLPSQFGKMGN
ncbi:MAG: hypothetical protein J6P46_06310 [Bacteroidales bacterium]|nr:hypothetical protein [Bacteroidales bacterium]